MNKDELISLKRNLFPFLKTFWLPWVLLILMLLTAVFCDLKWPLYVLEVLFVLILVIKPMRIIYGLIGTHGYISLFFFMFIGINFIFAGTYYNAFFKNAGITYETNQPHVEFNFFQDVTEKVMVPKSSEEYLPLNSKDTIHTYHKTTFWWVSRNTFLTSLMQEPTDFFSATATYTGDVQSENDSNLATAEAFHWFLIFHILISWILLGVFISLVYQRFRNT